MALLECTETGKGKSQRKETTRVPGRFYDVTYTEAQSIHFNESFFFLMADILICHHRKSRVKQFWLTVGHFNSVSHSSLTVSQYSQLWTLELVNIMQSF